MADRISAAPPGVASERSPGLQRSLIMATNKQRAAKDFRRMVKWIALAGVLMVLASLLYLYLRDAWSTHAVIATVLGVFVSVMIGCGLFALAFFSDKSGHDEKVDKSTRSKE